MAYATPMYCNVRQRSQTYHNNRDYEKNHDEINRNRAWTSSTKTIEYQLTPLHQRELNMYDGCFDFILTRAEQIQNFKKVEFLDISKQRILDPQQIKQTTKTLIKTNDKQNRVIEMVKRKIRASHNNKQYCTAINDNCPWVSHPLNDSFIPLEFPENYTEDVEHFLKNRFSRRPAVTIDSAVKLR
uniref:Uncharacterized protein n=1 Tax=Clytia hemisphaerica TaxID=252671 RepID=A0A7M5VD96_9CNID|eukprot:TCONS_00037722-protein